MMWHLEVLRLAFSCCWGKGHRSDPGGHMHGQHASGYKYQVDLGHGRNHCTNPGGWIGMTNSVG